MALGRIERDKVDVAALQEFAAGGLSVEPLAILLRQLGHRIALSQQLIERIAGERL